MRITDTIARSMGGLLRAKSRTLLTASAIGMGAFSMTLALAMGQGGGDYAQKIITANTDPNSLWVIKKQDEKSTDSYPSRFTGTPLVRFNKISVSGINQAELDKVAAVPGIKKVEPVFVIDQAVLSRPGQEEYQAMVNVYREGAYNVFRTGDGRNLTDNEVIIPDGYRQAMGFSTPGEAIGQKIKVTVFNGSDPRGKPLTVEFTVRAVTKMSTMNLSLVPTTMLVTLNSAKKLHSHIVGDTFMENKFIAANALMDPEADVEDTKAQVMKLDKAFIAQTPGDVYGALFQFVGVLQLVLSGFGVLAILTAIFSIVNTQYISVLERVQEIGLMKALGMGGRDVGRIFQLEAGIIGLFGSSIGTLLGFLTGTISNPFITKGLGFDAGTELMEFTLLSTFGVIGLLTLTAVIAGLLPSRRAALLDPVEALRSDRL